MHIRATALAAVALGSMVLPATAIPQVSIQVIHEGGTTNPDDPGDTKLIAIVNEAARIWERQLEGSKTFRLKYRYSSAGQPVRWERSFKDDEVIEFDPGEVWYFDPTPHEHSEFTFRSKLYRDLGPNERAWIGGTPPSVLEVGRIGAATQYSGAQGKRDLLTAALHGISHHLGIHDDDRAYRVDSPSIARFTASVDGDWHVPLDDALMYEHVRPGYRVLPSALEVLVVATEQADHSSVSGVDLDRKFMLPGRARDWFDPLAWVGAQPPTSGQEATLHEGVEADAEMTEHVRVNRLLVDEGSRLDVRLLEPFSVSEDCTITGGGPSFFEGSSVHATELRLRQLEDGADRFEAGMLTVAQSARLSLEGATVAAGGLLLNDSRLSGWGAVQADSLRAVDGALIEVLGGDELLIRTTNATTADEGWGFPSLSVEGGSATFTSPGAPGTWDLTFRDVEVGGGRTLRVDRGRLAVGSHLRLFPNAKVVAGGSVRLGVRGPAAGLLLDGASLQANAFAVAEGSTAVLTGSSATLTAERLTVEAGGLHAYLGARIESVGPDRIGRWVKSQANVGDPRRATLELIGAGTTWTNRSSVVVGTQRAEGELRVTGGATCEVVDLFLGDSPPDHDSFGTMTRPVSLGKVEVSQAELTVSDHMVVGEWGKGLLRSNESVVHAKDVTIGRYCVEYFPDNFDARGRVPDLHTSAGSVLIGSNSSWTATGLVTVGQDGQASLVVAGGGRLECADMVIGGYLGVGHVDVRGGDVEVAGDVVLGSSLSRTVRGNKLAGTEGWRTGLRITQTGTIRIGGALETWPLSGFLDVGGRIEAAAMTNRGTLRGSGTLAVPLVRNHGNIDLAHALRIEGDLLQETDGQLIVRIPAGPPQASGVLHVTGSVDLGGAVVVADEEVYGPGPVRALALTADGPVTLSSGLSGGLNNQWSLELVPGTPNEVYVVLP